MSNIDLPKSLRIGPFDYTVEDWEPREAANDRRYGEVSHVLLRIRVDTCHGPLQALNTLLHEIMHAIWHQYSMGKDDEEERSIEIMAGAWTQVYRDNPDLLRFIGEAVK